MDATARFRDVLEQAQRFVKARKPEASSFRQNAFTNAVVRTVTGLSGGYDGPSCREYIAVAAFGERTVPFEQATAELIRDDGLIFGPLRPEHVAFWREEKEFCYDDDPEDLAVLNAKKR